jgi:hypothetical protein
MPWVRVLRNRDLSPEGGYVVDIPTQTLGPWYATIADAKQHLEVVVRQPLTWQDWDARLYPDSALVASAYIGCYPLPTVHGREISTS